MEAVSANSGAYFSIGKECFQGDQPAVRKAVIKRWRLEIKPEDKEKYMKGELVEPIQPIIFYIDRNTPEKYIGCIIEAVRDWRPAFEQAGFKNAIDARLAPTAEEDPDLVFMTVLIRLFHGRYQDRIMLMGRLLVNPGPERLLLVTSVFSAAC